MTRSRQCFCRSDIVKFMAFSPSTLRDISSGKSQFGKRRHAWLAATPLEPLGAAR